MWPSLRSVGLGGSDWVDSFLVAQQCRIHLAMQEAQVQSLILEEPTCHGATSPMSHNC